VFHKLRRRWLPPLLARREAARVVLHLHYTSDVTIFFEWVGEIAPAAITVHQIDQFIDWQRNLGWKPSTIRRRVIALRMFFDYLAYAEDRELVNPVQPRRHYVANAESLCRVTSPTKWCSSYSSPSAIISAIARIFTLNAPRWSTRWRSVNFAGHRSLSPKWDRPSRLPCPGKGQRERMVYLSTTATRLLQDYLNQPSPLPRIARVSRSTWTTDHGHGHSFAVAKYCQQVPLSGSPAIIASSLPAPALPQGVPSTRPCKNC